MNSCTTQVVLQSWMVVMRILMLSLGLASAFAASMAAGEESTHYMQTVRPLLRARCVACHGALRQEGGLRLDTGEAIRTGGDTGAAIVKGDADASLLVRRVEHADAEQRMPPEGERLNQEQILALREWIAAGAVSPSDEKPDPDPRGHWAFRSPVRPELSPEERVLHPIDALINRELTQRALTVVPAADSRTLLRRVTFDLTGLPPAPEDQRAFCDDESAGAWERAVDRLLESPSYGERWARHWMDVWRYSDWYGRRSVPDVMNSYPTIWRWRDWIIRSLNSDKGYDQMVVEMLAGDEVAPDDLDTVAATGFVVRNWFKWNRDTWMRDQVEHTGKAFLGLWFQCALCHDHKYDPVSQREYFQLRAVFEPLELRHDRVPGEPDPGPHKAYVYGASYGPITSGMVRIFDHQPDAATRIYRGGDQRNIASDLEPVSVAIPTFLDRKAFEIQPIELPVTSWYPGLRDSVQAEEIAARQKAVDEALAELNAADQTDVAPIATQMRTAASLKLEAARAELSSWVSRTAAERARYIDRSPDMAVTAAAAANAERNAAFQKALSQLAAAELDLLRAESQPDTDSSRTEKIQKARAAVDTAKSAKAASEEALKKTDTTYTPLSSVFISKST
ncbi:MAG: DUF1549 domain-containing protein, partial [Planctomyces sp.]